MHHTGIVSKDIEKDRAIYTQLGYHETADPINDAFQHNRLLFLEKDGHVIELIEALDDKSTVFKSNEGIHHFCLETDDIEKEIQNIKDKRLGLVFTKVMEAPAFDNRRIVFVYLKSKVIVEFLEKKEE